MTSRGGGERKAAWGVSEVQRAGVTASERRGGWRMEEVKEKGRERERTRVNPSPRDITNQSCPLFFFPRLFSDLFFLHSCSTPHMDRGMAAVVFLFAGQWSCSGCHRSLWLDVCEECLMHGSTCPPRRPASVSACLHWTKPCFAGHFKAVLWRFSEVKNITKRFSFILKFYFWIEASR